MCNSVVKECKLINCENGKGRQIKGVFMTSYDFLKGPSS